MKWDINLIEDEAISWIKSVLGKEELFLAKKQNGQFTLWNGKTFFQTSEKVLDQCDDVSKIIESIIVKQA